jgi:cytochrome P450
MRDELESMVSVFNRHADDLFTQLDAAAAQGAQVDMQTLFRRFTMDSFSDAFFGADLRSLTRACAFETHFDIVQNEFAWRTRTDPLWKLVGTTRRTQQSLAFLDRFIGQIITDARRDPALAERTDMLAHYLRSTDAADAPFTDAYLRDMALNFLLAGRDTTASLLTSVVYCLGQHPEVERRLVEEVRRVVGLDTDPTPSQLPELRYMKQVLNETLRLYPPVPNNTRTAVHDDVLPNGFFLPAGTAQIESVCVCVRVRRCRSAPDPTATHWVRRGARMCAAHAMGRHRGGLVHLLLSAVGKVLGP